MDKDSIFLDDWKRILFGNAPVEFLLEVVIRSLFIYCLLLVVIRLLGKKMSSQLTITELAVMLMLGAIVSVPMQIPERGLLQGTQLLLLILLFERALSWFIYKSPKVEFLTQGRLSLLIKEGVIQTDEVEKLNISREQLFAVLRGKSIYQLGQVKRLYQEACGEFSLYLYPSPRPGLGILPDGDSNIQSLLKTDDAAMVCDNCGTTVPSQKANHPCPTCHHTEWKKAMHL
jgi:uncharacterized membrane protein YcaP (DUF421 family)